MCKMTKIKSLWTISGEHLETSRVKEARKTEIEFVEGMKVWKAVPRTKDMKVTSTRWVDINKGDKANPNYRSRLVARELKKDTLSVLRCNAPISSTEGLVVTSCDEVQT